MTLPLSSSNNHLSSSIHLGGIGDTPNSVMSSIKYNLAPVPLIVLAPAVFNIGTSSLSGQVTQVVTNTRGTRASTGAR